MTYESYYSAIMDLAEKDGARHMIISIPGVWEAVVEHYNNDALKKIGADTVPAPAVPSFGG